MTNDPQHTAIPIAPDLFWPLSLLVALGLLCWLLVGLMPRSENSQNPTGFDALTKRIGLSHDWIGPVLFACLILFTILGVSLFELARGFFRTEFDPQRFGIFASIVTAFMAGLFLGWRNLVMAKQADLQDQSLFNDKINKASEDLAARRQITRVIADKDGNEAVLTEWEDDLVTRAAAIDRLHGLAQERPEATPRIARQLSIYVRELSREKANLLKTPPEGATPDQLRDWARGLAPIRQDMQFAVQALGKLQKIEGHRLQKGDIDLREANLQGFDLKGLSFEEALFEGADLSGVVLEDASITFADLRNVTLIGANMYQCYGEEINFNESNLAAANLAYAQFQRTYFTKADFAGCYAFLADLSNSYFNYADFRSCELVNTIFHDSDLFHAKFDEAEVDDVDFHRANLALTSFYEARLHGVIFDEARLRGVNFRGSEVHSCSFKNARVSALKVNLRTQIRDADFKGAAVTNANEEAAMRLDLYALDFFADGRYPMEHKYRPAHWADDVLGDDDFHATWHAWRNTLPKAP